MSPSNPHALSQGDNVINVTGDYYDTSTRHFTTNVSIVNGKPPLDRLLEHIAPGALHDSAEQGPHAPKCHPETRTAIQQEVLSWIRHGDRDDNPRQILWLSGPAGSGKTAIAGTIADECHREGLLAGSFFFSAFSTSYNRHSKRSFILTLAYALLQQQAIVNVKDAILSIIASDPAVLEKHLDQQLDQLILGPLRTLAARSNQSNWPKVVIVDGVDECLGDAEAGSSPHDLQKSKEATHKEIVSVLARASLDNSFPFRIIIASRPEPVLTDFFDTYPDLALRLFLDKKYDPDADIRLFLEEKLCALRRKYNLANDWVSEETINSLVERASGQFVYITTALRYIEDTSRPPPEQLKYLLRHEQPDGVHSPFSALDTLYAAIMAASPDPCLAAKWLVICNAVQLHDSSRSGGDKKSRRQGAAVYRKAILESYPGEASFLLGGLSALIELVDDGRELSVKFYHKSLLDFLGDANRSGKLHVSYEDTTEFVEERYYRTLKNRGPQSANLQESDMDEFLQRFCASLPSWIGHHYSYEVSDVTWWLELLDASHSEKDQCRGVKGVFIIIDEKCTWNHQASCKVWRKVLLRHCKEKSWSRLPTALDLLRDRLNKVRHGKDWDGADSQLHKCFLPPRSS